MGEGELSNEGTTIEHGKWCHARRCHDNAPEALGRQKDSLGAWKPREMLSCDTKMRLAVALSSAYMQPLQHTSSCPDAGFHVLLTSPPTSGWGSGLSDSTLLSVIRDGEEKQHKERG